MFSGFRLERYQALTTDGPVPVRPAGMESEIATGLVHALEISLAKAQERCGD